MFITKKSRGHIAFSLYLYIGLQYFRPSLCYHLSLRSLFCQFLSGIFTQVLLFIFPFLSALGLQLCPITNGTLPTESSSIDSIPEHEDFAAYQRELSRALVAKGDTSTGSGEVLLNPLYSSFMFDTINLRLSIFHI